MRKIKIIFPVFIFILALSCQKDNSFDESIEYRKELESNDFIETEAQRGNNRIAVCHEGSIVTLPYNAALAHQSHGDAMDMDGDGFFDKVNDCSSGVDCDDNNPDINPAVTEIMCNGIDDDCNNETPEILIVQINPDGIIDSGDEYRLNVYPVDSAPAILWSGFSFTQANSEWDGVANTQTIINVVGDEGLYAAMVCANLSVEGCGDDWYLPSYGELNAMYEQLGTSKQNGNTGTGVMPDGIYWSSTEVDFTAAKAKNFNNGNQVIDVKFNEFRCRCVKR